MDRAVVEFDPLTDADWTRAKDDDRMISLGPDFIFCSIGGVVVRRMGFKFSRTGVDHLEVRMEIKFPLEVFHIFDGNFRKVGNGFIRHLDPFGRFQCFFSQSFLQEAALHFDNILNFIDEEQVDSRNTIDFFRFDAAAKGFCHHEDSFIIDAGEKAADIIEGLSIQFLQMEISFPYFQGTESLEKCPFQSTVKSHDFAGGLHLGADGTVGQGEFFKRPAGELADYIVNGRLEAGFRVFRDGIGDFIQVHAKGNFCCHLGNRIAGGLGCQGGRTAYTGIDFDDVVLIGFRIKAILYIATPFNLKVTDNIDGCGAEHLILTIGQGLGRSDNDGIPGMNAYGVDIFHSADDNAVICTVPHDFEFHFLPAGNAAFDQNLVDRGQFNAAVGNFFHFITVMGNAAAGTAKGISRTDNDRITDFISKSNGRFQFFKDFRFRYRLMDFFHSLFEEFTVFRMLDGMEGRTEEFHAILFEDSCIRELDCHVQAYLAAQGSQQSIRSFLPDDFRYERKGNWFDINPVSDIHIGHDGRRIAVDKDDFHSFFTKGTAGLGAGIVEFCRLTDDDGPGADDKYFFNILVDHFLKSSMAFLNSAKR